MTAFKYGISASFAESTTTSSISPGGKYLSTSSRKREYISGFATILKKMFPRTVDVVSEPATTARDASESTSSNGGGVASFPSPPIYGRSQHLSESQDSR